VLTSAAATIIIAITTQTRINYTSPPPGRRPAGST